MSSGIEEKDKQNKIYIEGVVSSDPFMVQSRETWFKSSVSSRVLNLGDELDLNFEEKYVVEGGVNIGVGDANPLFTNYLIDRNLVSVYILIYPSSFGSSNGDKKFIERCEFRLILQDGVFRITPTDDKDKKYCSQFELTPKIKLGDYSPLVLNLKWKKPQ